MAFISRLILYTPTTFGRYLLDYTIIDVSHSTPLSTHYSNPPLQHCLPKFFLHYSSSMINAGLIAARQLGQRQNSRITVYSQQMITTTGQKKNAHIPSHKILMKLSLSASFNIQSNQRPPPKTQRFRSRLRKRNCRVSFEKRSRDIFFLVKNLLHAITVL